MSKNIQTAVASNIYKIQWDNHNKNIRFYVLLNFKRSVKYFQKDFHKKQPTGWFILKKVSALYKRFNTSCELGNVYFFRKGSKILILCFQEFQEMSCIFSKDLSRNNEYRGSDVISKFQPQSGSTGGFLRFFVCLDANIKARWQGTLQTFLGIF